MSMEALAWARKQTLGDPTLKLLLIMIADKANEDNESWPSVGCLAKEVEIGPRQVQRGLAELESRGVLRREERFRENGSRQSNKLILNTTTSCHPRHPGQDPPVTHDVTPLSPVTGLEPKEETTNDPSALPSVISDEITSVRAVSTSEELDLGLSKPKKPESETRIAQRITTAYVEAQPFSNFPAVLGIVRKALRADHDENMITAALLRLAGDGRAVTTGSLRYELEGAPVPRVDPRIHYDKELTPKDRAIKDQIDRYNLDLVQMFPNAAKQIAEDRAASSVSPMRRQLGA
jgi:hypothetical protein